MQSEERQKRIEGHLLRMEFASLEELSELVDASISTVRRDLDMLEGKGTVRRTHGGARLANPKSDEFAFSARDTHQLAEKEAIGQACAGLIHPNQTVIIDAGTTCYHVARYLETVIYPRLGVLVGPLAVEAFSKIRADAAIMSCGGITLEGITNSHGLLIEIQRAMIQAARKVIFCIDSTKFGRQSITKLCDLATLDTIVTDKAAPANLVRAFRKQGIEVIIASGD